MSFYSIPAWTVTAMLLSSPALAGHGVRTADDLGELGADEVAELGIEGLDEARAAALILAARAEEIARLEREG